MRISDWSSDVCSSDLSAQKGRIRMRRIKQAVFGLALVIAVPAHAAPTPDYQAATATLAQYKQAIESRDLSGAEALFAPDAQIFGSGGIEGNFAHYRDHHLAPELKAFKSFAFKDYKISRSEEHTS